MEVTIINTWSKKLLTVEIKVLTVGIKVITVEITKKANANVYN